MSIGLGRVVKCLLCSSNEDYLCSAHNHILTDHSLSNAKLTLAVIGDGTPRASDTLEDELPIILTYERPIDLCKNIDTQLSEEERQDFKFIVVLTRELLEDITDVDLYNILVFNYSMCPIALVFETEEDLGTFHKFYLNWTVPKKLPLIPHPIVAIIKEWSYMLEFLRDGAIVPNRYIYLTCLSAP